MVGDLMRDHMLRGSRHHKLGASIFVSKAISSSRPPYDDQATIRSTVMTSSRRQLEPFPSFVDDTSPSEIFFSKMGMSGLSSLPGASELQQYRANASAKVLDFFQLKYYQYEVTFGMYMLTMNEKLVINTIVLAILAALSYAVFFGLQPFVVRSLCQLIYYMSGSLAGVEDICTGATCS